MKKAVLLVILICCSCRNDSYFDTVARNDVKLGTPKPGEWLDQHPEKGQSFESFVKTKPAIAANPSNVIYLRPIGNFNPTQQKQIELTREYLQIFFQTPTKTLDPTSDVVVPQHARRVGYDGNQQLLAGFILDSLLFKEKQPHAIALMGLTQLDLYPKPEWNFVFGLASYQNRIGVSSIYRLQEETLAGGGNSALLERMVKISSHEIGHMFGLRHCIDANCVMNGTNHLEETDKHTARLCSHCQHKLQFLLGYDNIKRLGELRDFFKRNGLEKEHRTAVVDYNSL